MIHRFGDLLTQYLHRKHGLSQAKLAAGILQTPSIVSEMSQGKRLSGPQARERVTAIIAWLQQQGAITSVDEADALLNAAGMSPLHEEDAGEVKLIRQLSAQAEPKQRPLPEALTVPHRPSTALPRHNLPLQLTPFVGRSEQIAQLVQQLQTHRLLTLTGAGGVGKTRLALEVAARLVDAFDDGVWFVDLAPLTDEDSMIQRILDLWCVPEQPGHSLLAMLIAYLHSKEMLLILDNCEHLIGDCAKLAAAILQNCPQVTLLATSREPLNLRAEIPWRVPSLSHPDAYSAWDGSPAFMPLLTLSALYRFEAVALFVERARMRAPNFTLGAANAPAIAHICRRLDGIPLALEMAAARVNVFTVEEMAARLDGAFDARFQLLTSGERTASFRHQTLRAMLEWSFTLLTPAEQRLLAHLSVFTGGWTVAAAEEVLQADLEQLAQLVNKSLVIAEQQGGQTRYRQLETVRQFATEQMRGNEQEQREVEKQHSRYYLRLLGEQEKPLQSPQQRSALETLHADFANISAAWYWAVVQHDFALLAPAVHALFLYCETRGHFREGMMLFSTAATALTAAAVLSEMDQPNLQSLLGRVLARLGAYEVLVDNLMSGMEHLQQALDHSTSDWERAFVLAYQGQSAIGRSEQLLGRSAIGESLALARRCGDLSLTAQALFTLTDGLSDFIEGIRYCEASLTLWRQVGRPDRAAFVLTKLAWYQCCLGEYEKAIANWQENLEICTQLGMQRDIAWTRDLLGWAAWCQNDLEAARNYLQDALDLFRTLGMSSKVAMVLAEMALVLRAGDDVRQAVAMAHQAVVIIRETGDHMRTVLCLTSLGAALIGAGDAAGAREALIEAALRAWAGQYFAHMMMPFYYFAELLVLETRAANSPIGVEQKALAVTLLTRVCAFPETWHIFKDKAAQLLAEIEADLPAEIRAAAIARGQSCTLEESLNMLSCAPLPSSS